MATTVTDNPADNRYEIDVDGELAGVIMYRLTGDVIAFLHTETLEGFEGKGLAGELVRQALDDVRSRQLALQPLCPYVSEWIGKHPEYEDLVAA
jgi:uncharacterized protein